MTDSTQTKTAASPPLGRRRLRWACLALIALLYIVSVPWYRDADEPLTVWLGLPNWVAVALLCYVAVAFLNGIAWLATDVPDDMPDAREGDQR
ncbi:MAG: hypothetical protein AB8G23_16465 [Myxococcota bacterium]